MAHNTTNKLANISIKRQRKNTRTYTAANTDAKKVQQKKKLLCIWRNSLTKRLQHQQIKRRYTMLLLSNNKIYANDALSTS